MLNEKKNIERNQFTEHHVIPRSRFKKKTHIPLGYERGDLEEKFLDLVGSREKVDAIAWIVECCWGGNWEYVREALLLKNGGVMPEFCYEERRVMLDHEIHKKYHRIFKNLTPREIIIFLVVYLWNWGWQYIEEALKQAS